MSKDLFKDFPAVSSKQWKQKIQMDLKGADYNETLITKTDDGVDIQPFYHRDQMTESFMPESPDSWKLCEKIRVDSEKETLQKIEDVLKRGTESLWLIITSEKIEIQSILNKIDLAQTPVYIEFDFFSEKYITDLIGYLNNKNHRVSFGIDVVGNLARSGNWHKDLDTDFKFLEKVVTKAKNQSLLSIDVSLYQNAGANIPQQIAYACAHANEYLNRLEEDKKLLSAHPGKLTFKVSMGNNYFFEIAKLKALRKVFDTIAKEYNLQNAMEILAFPSRRNKTLYDYNINLLRTTTECMSAILGGADAICNSAYDEIYHEENEFGSRIARNQLLVLKNESYFDEMENPAEGSYYLETLTRQFAESALKLFKKIENGEGFITGLKKGAIQQKIKESASKEQEKVRKKERVLVGSNKYENPEDRMKNELERNPFIEKNTRKTLIEPILERRLTEELEQKRMEDE